MASLTLQVYLERVESLVAGEHYDRAIMYCQHALRTLPRCVDFYRLLGQACLESDRPDDAADMFRRVLGVDPQNFVARVGLGVVAEGISAYEEADWQWNRALELEPNHGPVRDELRGLHAKVGAPDAHGRLHLTRTTLGYIYMRGEQYDRAADEFRAVLRSASGNGAGHDRFDVQIALAEALHHAGHRRAAAEQCRAVLTALPNALKANLILGSIVQDADRPEEAAPLFERAQAVDPANRLAQRLLETPLLPSREITLDEPASGPLVAAPSDKPKPSSASEPATPTVMGLPQDSGADLPDWLRALRSHAGVLAPEPPPSSPVAADDATEPDWMRALRTQSAVDVAPVTEIRPDTASLATTDEPDWLKALREPSADEVTAAPESAEATPAPAAPAEPPAAELPDWMRSADAATPAPAAPAELPAAELPDWMRSADAATPVPAAPTEPPAAELPDWMRSTDAATPAPAAPAEPPAADELPEPPDWLKALQMRAAEQQPPAPVEPPHPPPALPVPVEPLAPEPEVPEWLRALRAEKSPAPVEPLAPREPSTYLDDASGPASIESQPMPSGEAEHQARLDLARMLVDLDVDEALDQYAQLAAASPAIRQQARDDLRLLAATAAENPRVDSVLAQLRDAPAAPRALAPEAPAELAAGDEVAGIVAPVEPVETSEAIASEPAISAAAVTAEAPHAVSVDVAAGANAYAAEPDEMAQMVSAAGTAHEPAEPIVSEEAIEAVESSAAAEPEYPGAPVVDETMVPQAAPVARQPREASFYLDDSSAPPSVESQPLPRGAAEYRAWLDLARALKFIDVDEAADQYARLTGAPQELVEDAIRDLAVLALKNPHAAAVLADLRRSIAPATPSWVGDAQSSAPIPASAQPDEPIVEEETLQAGADSQAGAAAPALPIVDEEIMDEPALAETPAAPAPITVAEAEPVQPPAPREATVYLADSSAPPSVETQAAPTGAAEHQARLDLARSLRDLDLGECLAQYRFLIDAQSALLPDVIGDLQAIIAADPQARAARVQLADALTRAGRLAEAIAQYRLMV
ncbi:MAG: tetratricopeptide repeat protein [Chloroflexi bacterium]|nr:tetratricopeptide repeat protein [Chloroflexota bacterium]